MIYLAFVANMQTTAYVFRRIADTHLATDDNKVPKLPAWLCSETPNDSYEGKEVRDSCQPWDNNYEKLEVRGLEGNWELTQPIVSMMFLTGTSAGAQAGVSGDSQKDRFIAYTQVWHRNVTPVSAPAH